MAINCYPLGGGRLNTASMARVAHGTATSGRQGVRGPGDLQVKAQSTPNGTVLINHGSCTVRNVAPYERESYAVENSTETTLSIPQTGSSPRNDLVVMRISDPTVAGTPFFGQTITDVANLFVISGVANNATAVSSSLGYPALPLARINIPANTSAITNAMITNLTELANPRTEQFTKMWGFGPTTPEEQLTSTTGEIFFKYHQFMVDIPYWATYLNATVAMNQLGNRGGKSIADYELKLGSSWTSAVTLSHQDGPDSRFNVGIGGGGMVPENIRGTTQRLHVFGRRWSNADCVGRQVLVSGSHFVFNGTFEERA